MLQGKGLGRPLVKPFLSQRGGVKWKRHAPTLSEAGTIWPSTSQGWGGGLDGGSS